MQYVVKNENTLGYIINSLTMGVLHGNVIDGGHDWKNGPVAISLTDRLRPATLADFEHFRVDATGHIV